MSSNCSRKSFICGEENKYAVGNLLIQFFTCRRNSIICVSNSPVFVYLQKQDHPSAAETCCAVAAAAQQSLRARARGTPGLGQPASSSCTGQATVDQGMGSTMRAPCPRERYVAWALCAGTLPQLLWQLCSCWRVPAIIIRSCFPSFPYNINAHPNMSLSEQEPLSEIVQPLPANAALANPDTKAGIGTLPT